MQHSRRLFIRGVGGIALGLPFLEGLTHRKYAYAQTETTAPFSIFIRQANGPAHLMTFKQEMEPNEPFWPQPSQSILAQSSHLRRGFAAKLTTKNPSELADDEATVNGRLFEELAEHLDGLLLLSDVNYVDPSGCGHENRSLQALTARSARGSCGRSTVDGESIDFAIQKGLSNRDDYLYLYAGNKGGYSGGECISFSEGGRELVAEPDPFRAYERVVAQAPDSGLDEEVRTQLIARERSLNDFLKEQFSDLYRNTSLSKTDVERLKEHQAFVRDIETDVTNPEFLCSRSQEFVTELESFQDPTQQATNSYVVVDGALVMQSLRYHIRVATLAVKCGRNRAVSIQVGNGNDGTSAYRRADGSLMENYHFVSHRVPSHASVRGNTGPDDPMFQDHMEVDRQFARTYKYLIEQLKEAGIYERGLAIWYNDSGDGPAHSGAHIPWVIGGGAGGQLKTGQYLQLARPKADFETNADFETPAYANHRALLNTIGAAMGLKEEDGQPLSTFGSGAPGQFPNGGTEGHITDLLGTTELGSLT